MFIQPSVQSASYGATFASSVSATGVEQTASRAPLPPVEQASRDSATQNRENPFPSGNAAATAPSTQVATTQGDASKAQTQPSPEESTAKAAGTNPTADESTRQQQLQEEADQALLAQLKARDREVRVHEAAHAAVGGRYAGSASFQYRRGPDGQNYAVGGEVSISTGPVAGDPQATIEKARTIRAAALAPAEPSAQDRQIAAQASQMELNARSELAQMEVEARVEAEKAREEAEAKKLAEEEQRKARADERNVAGDASQKAAEKPEKAEPAPVFTPVATDNDADRKAGSDKKAADKEREDTPRPNARQRLEQILLGSAGILDQANRQGLVDPQNPYGKSGFLDVIA